MAAPPSPREPHPLARRALSGAEPELARLAASGLLPLPPEDLIPIQVALAEGADPALAEIARGALGELPARQLSGFLRDSAPPETLGYFARTGAPPAIEAILRRPDVPRDLLVELAPRLSPPLQEVLLLRQDAIREAPAILDALATNPALSAYSRRRVHEYREHLLPAGAAPAEETPEPGTGPEGEGAVEALLDDPEVASAIETARAGEAKGERDEVTGLSDSQIRTLPIAVRVQLARTASRTLRGILVRDPNPQVALAVFKGPKLPEQEVERIASSRSVSPDVLEEISRHREWMVKYPILSALAHNPRTPTGIAMRLLPRLSVRELRTLGRDRNVPDVVRRQAARLYTMKRT